MLTSSAILGRLIWLLVHYTGSYCREQGKRFNAFSRIIFIDFFKRPDPASSGTHLGYHFYQNSNEHLGVLLWYFLAWLSWRVLPLYDRSSWIYKDLWAIGVLHFSVNPWQHFSFPFLCRMLKIARIWGEETKKILIWDYIWCSGTLVYAIHTLELEILLWAWPSARDNWVAGVWEGRCGNLFNLLQLSSPPPSLLPMTQFNNNSNRENFRGEDRLCWCN